MSEPFRMGPEELMRLLRAASGKPGRAPGNLVEELRSGRYDALLEAVGADREKLIQVVGDPEKMTTLLQSEPVKALLRQLLGTLS